MLKRIIPDVRYSGEAIEVSKLNDYGKVIIMSEKSGTGIIIYDAASKQFKVHFTNGSISVADFGWKDLIIHILQYADNEMYTWQ